MLNKLNSNNSLRSHAQTIWRAGVDAVDSKRLIQNVIDCSVNRLSIAGESWQLADLNSIVIVGGGKAGAGMAIGVEEALGNDVVASKVSGWVNVPADCVAGNDVTLQKTDLHAARPAGVNEPTAAGVEGTDRIFEMISPLGKEDLCIVLLSGGGSALLPAPVNEISLAEKQQVTQQLMHAGATINELNTVRKQLSRIKGGGLARAAGQTNVITLIISDVIDDPLEVIASGPTTSNTSTAQQALDILNKFTTAKPFPQSILNCLQQKATTSVKAETFPHVTNHIIGNNRVALLAAKQQAEELGYRVFDLGSNNGGVASNVGSDLAKQALQIQQEQQPGDSPVCLLSGGEPIVHLAKTDVARKGGRNQELVLAAMQQLWEDGMPRIAFLSGGTDGEDGPTNAAGAFSDSMILNDAKAHRMQPADYLAINNSYPFFETLNGLLKTGPTHTNVMDLRVVLVEAS